MQKAKPRTSFLANAEQFVTVEYQNNKSKKKNEHHRLSIFNELKMTETLIEASLNKMNKSSYYKTQSQKLELQPSNIQIKNTKTVSPKQKNYMSKQIRQKLQQISNISKYFERACEPKKKAVILTPEKDEKQNIPLQVRPQLYINITSKQKQNEHQNIIANWKGKVNHSNNYLTQQRNYLTNHGYRIKNIQSSNKQIDLTAEMSKKDLTEKYYSKINHSINLPKFKKQNCESVCERNAHTVLQKLGVERQNPIKLQQFIEGGYKKQINEYSKHFHISNFSSNRQKFKTLDKIYRHVKQKINLDFKNFDKMKSKQLSMETVVFYLENQLNMTEADKKQMKNHLKIID